MTGEITARGPSIYLATDGRRQRKGGNGGAHGKDAERLQSSSFGKGSLQIDNYYNVVVVDALCGIAFFFSFFSAAVVVSSDPTIHDTFSNIFVGRFIVCTLGLLRCRTAFKVCGNASYSCWRGFLHLVQRTHIF